MKQLFCNHQTREPITVSRSCANAKSTDTHALKEHRLSSTCSPSAQNFCWLSHVYLDQGSEKTYENRWQSFFSYFHFEHGSHDLT